LKGCGQISDTKLSAKSWKGIVENLTGQEKLSTDFDWTEESKKIQTFLSFHVEFLLNQPEA
jgi:hypothetical protein